MPPAAPAHTDGMEGAREQELAAWEARVREAALAGDAALLTELYAEGVERLGPDAAHAWALALAAYDATAVTG